MFSRCLDPRIRLLLTTALIVAAACQRTQPTPEPPAGSFVVDSVVLDADAGEDTVLTRARVSKEFFSALQTAPVLGRTFSDPDFTSPTRVAVLSGELFQTKFGGRFEIIGHAIKVGGEEHIIIGILPPQFEVPPGVSIWTPQVLR